MFHVVDDVLYLRGLLKKLIESAGHDCMQFDSAETYLEYFNSPEFVAPVAIFTNYLMTGKTGLELIEQVREKLPLQKAVIVSGSYSSELNAAIESDFCYSLDNPYDPEKLLSLLKALVKCEKEYQPESGGLQARCEFGLEHKCPHYSGSSAKE